MRRFGRFVKGGVVHNDKVLVGEARAEPGFEPGVEHRRIARAFEQDGFCKILSDTGGDQ